MEELLGQCEAIVITVDHDEFKSITPELLKKNDIKVVIDGKNCLDKEKILAAGIIYKGIGR